MREGNRSKSFANLNRSGRRSLVWGRIGKMGNMVGSTVNGTSQLYPNPMARSIDHPYSIFHRVEEEGKDLDLKSTRDSCLFSALMTIDSDNCHNWAFFGSRGRRLQQSYLSFFNSRVCHVWDARLACSSVGDRTWLTVRRPAARTHARTIPYHSFLLLLTESRPLCTDRGVEPFHLYSMLYLD